MSNDKSITTRCIYLVLLSESRHSQEQTFQNCSRKAETARRGGSKNQVMVRSKKLYKGKPASKFVFNMALGPTGNVSLWVYLEIQFVTSRT